MKTHKNTKTSACFGLHCDHKQDNKQINKYYPKMCSHFMRDMRVFNQIKNSFKNSF